jgi:hypothetical protein
MLTMTHVCEGVYFRNKLCKIESVWDNKYDGRGEGFVTELITEIRDVISNEVAMVAGDKMKGRPPKVTKK